MNDIKSHLQYFRTKGKPDLAGRVQPVQLTELLYTGEAIGKVADGDNVLIVNGRLNLDKNGWCLVKFDNKEGTTRGNFVASGIPNSMGGNGLKPEEYILYGSWISWMKKREILPDLQEINRYYDPGHVCWVVYLSECFGPCIIYGDKPPRRLMGRTHHKIIKENFPDPLRASRLVLAESTDELYEFTTKVWERRVNPIKLDNLETNWKVLGSEGISKRMQQAQV